MNFWIIVSIIEIFLYLVIGVLVLKVWKFGKAQRRFFFLMLVMSGWLFNALLEVVVRSNLIIYDWLIRLDYVLGALIAYFFILFAFHFPRNNLQLSFKKELLLFIPILLLIILSLSGLILTTKNYDELDYNLSVYILYLSILVVYFLIISTRSLYKKYKNSKGLTKLQLKYFLLGYTVSVLSLLFLSFYGAVISRISDEQFLIYISISIIFPIITTYSILRYRLMDINFVIKRGVTHIVSLIIIVAVYTYLVLITQNFLEINQLWTTLMIILIIAVTIFPFRKWLFSAVDNLFYKEEIERRKKADDLIAKLPKVSEYDQIQEEIYSLITKDKEISEVRILISDNEKGMLETTYPKGAKKVTIPENLPMIRYLSEEKTVLVKEEIPYLLNLTSESKISVLKDLEAELLQTNTEVLITLKSDYKKLIGLILVGPKKSGNAYTVQDINFFKKISAEASIGLANVLLYKHTIEGLKRRIEKGEIGVD